MKTQAPSKEKLSAARARKLLLSNDSLQRRFNDRAQCLACLASVEQAATKLFVRRLQSEWPVAVASLDVPSARGFGKRLGDLLRNDINALGGMWK